MLQSYGLQQDVIVSHHLRSGLYLGRNFLSDIPAPSAIHRNLRRSKVVENIVMVGYTPISATEITSCHSKIRWVMLSLGGKGRCKAPREGELGAKPRVWPLPNLQAF